MGFWSNAFKGHPVVEIVEGARYLTPHPLISLQRVYVVPSEEHGNITFELGKAVNKPARFVDLAWENEQYSRSAGKTAAGVIVGGVLAGPVGGVIGAAVGAKRKNESKASMLCQAEDGSEFEIVIKCDVKMFRQLEKLIAV